jgi:feruloyl esterase
VISAFVIAAGAALGAGRVDAATCAELANLALADTIITSAAVVAPGAFSAPTGAAAPQATYARLPEFCRVMATIRPTRDSDIRIEVWLPASNWNGKFQAVGNYNWAGVILYPSLAGALAGGYATAATDGGHAGNSAAFAVGHPEKVADLGYRAVHEMAVKARSLIDAFYGAPPKLSLWNGCSQGGRQGVAAAIRHPEDFDAIAAGAPAVNWMHLHAGRMAANRAANRTPASTIPRAKYRLVHDAVLRACDARDGVTDGVLGDPRSCTFDPQVLQCRPGQSGDTCLTPPQVEAARSLYSPVMHPVSGAVVLPGLVPGSELGWNAAAAPQPVPTSLEAYRYLVFEDPKWDPARFNAATDIDRMLRADPADSIGTTSTDLKAFFDRGGKLLLYHGWSDAQVTPLNTIDYFNKVVSRFGPGIVGQSIQLYMVPGMDHCAGGPGTDRFDKMQALEEWVATGSAPRAIEAAHATAGIIDRTRPLCPYGQVAVYGGRGSTNYGPNFSCVAR